MDVKPKTVTREVSNFLQSNASKTGWGGFPSEDINKMSMVSSRTSTAYKYTRTYIL